MELLKRLDLTLFLLCINVVFISVSGQNCDPITQVLLGNSSGLSSVGLIPSAYVTGGDSQTPPDVQILQFNVVCEQSGDRINTARGVSVLVRFDCNSDRNDLANIMCTDGFDDNTVQFQFACSSTSDGDQWSTTIAGSSAFVASSSTMATLTTPLENTCGICIDDAQQQGSDPVTHCFDCHPDCDRGQMRCFGTGDGDCCNFYELDLCVADCRSGLVPNSEFICGCPAPTITNGQVSSTGIAMIGDTVTYSCDALANLNGNATRTCTLNGWDVDEPTCDIFRCPDNLTPPDGGSVAYSDLPPIVGETASYTCDAGRFLDGNEQRTCQNDGTWGGTDPMCIECGVCQNGGTCYLSTMSCQCPMGFTGGDCSDVDCGECNTGECDTTSGVCLCPSTHTGADCSEPCSDKIQDCELCENGVVCNKCAEGFQLSMDRTMCIKNEAKPGGSSGACGTGCIIGIIVAILAAIILSTIVAVVIFALYKYLNDPATKIAKTDTEGLNGVARDNPLYVEPAALEDA